MSQGEGVRARMLTQRSCNVPGRRDVAHRDKNCYGSKARAPGNYRQKACAAANPIATHGHCRAQQQRERRVAWHRVVLLRRRESEKEQKKSRPAQGDQAGPTSAIHRLEGKPSDRRKIYAPWKQPQELHQPEIKPWHCVVVTRIPHIQESQELLVDEKEPQKSVIFPGSAV